MRRRAKGQALVEFALVATFGLLPLILGLTEGARLIYTNNMLNNAAREGARTGSVQGGWIGKPAGTDGCSVTGGPGVQGPVCPSLTDFTDNIRSSANALIIAGTRIPLSTDTPDPDHYLTVTCAGVAPSKTSCATGATLKVTITYKYVPFIPILSNGSIPLGASASMAIQ